MTVPAAGDPNNGVAEATGAFAAGFVVGRTATSTVLIGPDCPDADWTVSCCLIGLLLLSPGPLLLEPFWRPGLLELLPVLLPLLLPLPPLLLLALLASEPPGSLCFDPFLCSKTFSTAITRYKVGAGPDNPVCAPGPAAVAGTTSGNEGPSVFGESNWQKAFVIRMKRKNARRNNRCMATA